MGLYAGVLCRSFVNGFVGPLRRAEFEKRVLNILASQVTGFRQPLRDRGNALPHRRPLKQLAAPFLYLEQITVVPLAPKAVDYLPDSG